MSDYVGPDRNGDPVHVGDQVRYENRIFLVIGGRPGDLAITNDEETIPMETVGTINLTKEA